MKAITIFGLFTQALLLRSVEASACKKRGQCNADNCARAATGTFDGKQSLRTAACSSFQQCTVIPPTATVTSVVNVTPVSVTQVLTVATLTSVQVIPTTVTLGGAVPQKRAAGYGHLNVPENDKRALTTTVGAASAVGAMTICPTQVPTTASACSGTSRYASACSCAGYTKSYTTLAAPSTTVTVTSVAPQLTQTVLASASTVVTSFDVATVTPIAAAAAPTTFMLQINFPPGSDANTAQYQSLFVSQDASFGELSARPQSNGIRFMLDSGSYLVNAGSTGAATDRVGVAVTINSATFIVWDTRQHYQASHVSYPFTRCVPVPSVLVPGSFQLQCSGSSGSVAAICDANQWNSMGGAGVRSDAYIVLFSPGNSHAGCYPFELTQVASS